MRAIATDSAAQSLDLAGDIAAEYGALTLSVYRIDVEVVEHAHDAAAFSDFHATGTNPAANAAPADAVLVAHRFRVVQPSRSHVAPQAKTAGA